MASQTAELLEAIRNAQKQHEEFKTDFWQFAVNNLSNEIPAEVVRQFKSLKMTHSEMQILSKLAGFHIPLTPYKTLQAEVSFSQGMFSRYINRLNRANLIIKTKQADNKKEVYLSITTIGQYVAKLHTRMHQLEQQNNEQALANFSPDEIQTAIKIINSLNTAPK
ncbi:MarR family winged helix-turn-helix transcriptional regulator [Paucilactobacillus kaifaensis]|uniref:MarR family winged helix-turn-helix transcriptional regulator n=1 Tax=Paucilactobacillus kaifaensis TaxID=2559921 RepID=UPI0010F7C833|nr:MarR family transcriptional regulator [Paucilactobacillus kaifaensis]